MDLSRIVELLMAKKMQEELATNPPSEQMPEERFNMYTAIKNMDWTPHVDDGNNNFYTALGLKPRK